MSAFTAAVNPSLAWDSALISRYNLSGPRYTSYPTAPQFSETFTAAEFHAAVARSNVSQRPLSLYFHIPFCETLCFYCGCNKIVTPNKTRAAPYLQSIERDIKQQAGVFNTRRPVEQLHWGGGTPTYISDAEMTQLMQATGKHFSLLDDDSGEYSVEIHPGKIRAGTMAHLRRLGFNRVSMGVQDFDPKVQAAVNRYNSVAEVRALVDELRALQYRSISMDLIYGLPHQSCESFAVTLEHIIELSPDRLSLFNYAHLPHFFKSQALINDADIPAPQCKLDILQMSIARLTQAGYVYIGMDHFAKPNDSLVLAQQAGKLQRNFQGYSTHGNCDLVSFGVSAISSFGGIYVQNSKYLKRYCEQIDSGNPAWQRGFVLSDEDHLRQYVINQLICQFYLRFDDLREKFALEPTQYFANELASLTPMVEDGLLQIDAQGIQVKDAGRLLVRRVCMVFDAYLQAGNKIHYSKVI
jgi:oxygen-independent coproporphyrinogen III oxidase